ncbi:response regulator transcription factor [Streptomyces sp. MRC013]|uniref:LuxR C-terminal-related transcriptional regulator n=1 Tax=Streptomyces sp. MRC013 TaxID=2898276 RepID=UPI002025F8F2|nr:response regulator transcription factor [Streptomyces sp. MRC013]URM92436.1 response regulator transcription factor [Streptomyces sp. MRC013]
MDDTRGPHDGDGGAAANGPRLAAVDDHSMILRGIPAYLTESAPEIEWVGSAGNVGALPSAVTALPSVVLLDIELNDGSDVADNVGRLRAWGPRVMLFSREHRPVVVRRGIEAGALGLVLKEDPEAQLVEAVRAAHTGNAYVSGRLAHQIVNDPRGRVRLSPRQLEVVELLARGFRTDAIARRLYMTEETVRTHRRRAIEAFGRNRGTRPAGTSELVYRLMADGHIDLGPAGSDGPGTPPPGAAG